MKYIGKKSLSSFLSVVLKVFWWLILVALVVYGTVITINLFNIAPGNLFTDKIAALDMGSNNMFLFYHWNQIITWPLAGKVVVWLFFVACAVLRLMILTRAQRLFVNFKNDIVFDKANIDLISNMSKLLTAESIISWNLGTFFVGVLLLILCQIFRHGADLQEEHDLTV